MLVLVTDVEMDENVEDLDCDYDDDLIRRNVRMKADSENLQL